MKQQIIRIRRRNGRLAKFDQERVTTAIYQAVTAVSEEDGKLSQKLSNQVVKILNRRFKGRVPTVEDVQDVVEEVLIRADLTEIAKAYIIYREQRRKLREAVKVTNESLGMVDQYLKEVDWEVKENANMTYSLQGLNNYISNGVTKRYWFEKVYPLEIREAAEGGDFHIHDLGILAPYTFFGKETVVIKLNGKIELVSLESLYNNIIQKEEILNKKDQAFAKYPRNLFILDKEGWTRVSRLVRKKKQKEMRFIKSEQGRSVIVTDNHPFIVKNQKNGQEKEILAGEVKEKEHLSLSCFLPSLLSSEKLFTKKKIYLAQELIDKDYQDFFLEGFKWRDFVENWGGDLKTKGTLSVSNKANSLDNYFELTEDLGYLVGIFIAEGHYHSWRMEITLGEEKIIKKVQKICSNLGIRTYIKKHEQIKRISINCSTLKLVFEKVFQINPLSQNKTLPIDILNYNFDFIKGLIAGIVDGDGNVSTQGSQIIIRTASRTMLEQVAILLQFFGVVCRDRAIEGVGSKRVYKGKEIIQKFPLYGISFSKKEKLNLPSFKYQKANVGQKNWRVEEYGWNKVLNNKSTFIADDFIYDITTDSHTFLCNGLLVHNCVGWSLEDILRRGFTGVYGKISSKPAKHLRVALGQLVNFFYTLQGEAAGAIAISSFDTFLAPFIRYDKLTYPQIKQAMQEFIFNCNVPTRVGFQCMSEDTEILTKDGWKKYNQIKKGNIIATFNIEKGFIEYLPVNNVFAKKYKGIMYNLKNRISDQLISPEHRVVRRMFNSDNYISEKIEKVLDLKSPFMVPVGSEGNIFGDNKLDEDLVKLIAWIIAEGSIDKSGRGSGRISIYQSKKRSPENYEEIISLCHNLKLKYSERTQVGLGADCNVIRFDAVSTRKILQFFKSNKNKGIKFIPELIVNSDTETSRLFLETYIKGDGHDGCKITTTEEKLKDGLLQIMVNAGYGATVLVRRPDNPLSKKDRYIIRIIKHKDTYINQVKKINYQGIIWCPNTKNETVIARRNDKVFITGNTPFTNITLDLIPPKNLAKLPVIIGGKTQKEKYGDFQKEMDLFNKAFYEVIMEGDATQRVFTFPIPTINITKDFDWGNPNYKSMWEATSKYGINYFSNFINSELDPEDIRSMCCRLRLNNKDLHHRGGGLFGSAPLTGSIGVVTINLPRIGYLTKTKKEFFNKLENLMDLARESLEIKRKTLENFVEKELYPYSKFYLSDIKKLRGQYWANHFSTIGLVGMNEASLNFLKKDIISDEGQKFAEEVLDFMNQHLLDYQKETKSIYNLEATPAEGTSYRLAKKDKERYPQIITAGKDVPYYTNSTQLPVDCAEDLFGALALQDNCQTKYTGGCIEKGNKVLTNKGLLNIEYIVKNFNKLKPIKVLGYNIKKGISEWDSVVDAVFVDVKKKNKIKIKAERGLDIITSDWHPFFVLERIKVNSICPVCQQKVENIKGFASHLGRNPKCREEYLLMFKYRVLEKRADELKKGDYILQNFDNLYPEKSTALNNDLMWLIGFFIGDGCISKFIDNRGGHNLEKYRVRFHSENQRALQKIVRIISEHFHTEVKVIKNDKRSKSLREVTISKKVVLDFFFKYGFNSGKKVYNISVPQKVRENFNKSNVFAFLSGLIDSDGHISKRDGDFEYQTVSDKLAEDILEISTRAGLMISKSLKASKRKNEVNIYRLRVPRYQMTRIKDKLNDSVNCSKIKTKLSDRKKRQLPVIRVTQISKVDVKDNQFYDLTTKKNHNYLAGKNTLVFIHNTVFHAFLGERIFNPESVKNLIKKVFEKFHLPYFTLTPTFSICPEHNYLNGEHFTCPECGEKTEVYSRIVGYLRPVQQWNEGKQEEFKQRKEFVIEDK